MNAVVTDQTVVGPASLHKITDGMATDTSGLLHLQQMHSITEHLLRPQACNS